MPILLQTPVKRIPEQEFHELDYEIMKLAFSIHNEFGRFYDENIYRAELQRRCKCSGINTIREFVIKLVHEGYEKPLFIDLLINHCAVYELKAIKSLVDPNRAQTLNYLFATETQHGKLVNFRPKSVEHEFVSTQLNQEKRRSFTISDKEWLNQKHTKKLKDLTINILNDWGAFFDTDIYLDALCHFLGGKDCVIRDTIICNDNKNLGTQQIPHLSNNEAFCLTSVTKNIRAYQKHLIRFLKHTQLDALHWINFNRSNISFTSLSRKLFCP